MIGGSDALARSGPNTALIDAVPTGTQGASASRGGDPPVWRLRPASVADRAFLGLVLCATANWDPAAPRRSLPDVRGDPESARYLDGWDRVGDAGLVAEGGRGVPVGAVGYRLFPPTEPGHGYVDDATPELASAVVADHRGRGIGAGLMQALVDRARAAGVPALSLRVAPCWGGKVDRSVKPPVDSCGVARPRQDGS
jgi:GNAT superfamily N-acetyltransferase